MVDEHSSLVKQHFESSYQDYDQLIPKLVPGYEDLKGSVLAAIGSQGNQSLEILDLGCGTAALGAAILDQWPESRYIGIDLSQGMIAQAKARLVEFDDRVQLIRGDFLKLTELDLPFVDVVISVLAIHHFDDKGAIYRAARGQLTDGGMFILSDLVVDPQHNRDAYEFRRRHMLAAGLSQLEIDKWFTLFNTEDRPSTIEENLEYLQEAGFTPETIWQNPSYATIRCQLLTP